MVAVDVEGDGLVITLRGWDRALAGRRSVRVLLDAITEVAATPEMIDVQPVGMKLPGSFVPGWPRPIFGGTFVERGEARTRTFWSLRRATAEQILRIAVADRPDAGHYGPLVLQVPDAQAVAGEIQRELRRRRARFA